MDVKIITGFLLWFCLIASLSISQSASAKLDSRQRFRRQDDKNAAATTASADDNPATTEQSATKKVQAATAILADGTTIVLPQGSTAIISAAAEATTAAGGTAAAADVATATAGDGATTAPGGTAAAEATTAAGGTAGAEATTAAGGTAADEASTAAGGTADAGDGATTDAGAATADGDTTGAGAADGATTAAGGTAAAENGTDVLTSAKPGNGHATEGEDASNNTAGATEATTIAAGADAVTIDANATTIATNDTATDANAVTTVSLDDTTGGNETISLTTIGTLDDNENVTRSNTTEEVTTQAPDQPGPGPRVELRVVVSPEILQVQRGRTFEITCSVYGADATTNIYWIQEEPERRYAFTDPADANDKQVTMSQVSLKARITIDDASKIGKYTCMAQDAAGNSGSGILTMQEGGGIYPAPGIAPGQGSGSGYLRIVAPDMAEGDYVEIQCEGAGAEDEGRIQWFFNNRLLNDEQPLYPRGKTLHIRPISRPYLGNYRCSIPGSSYADANSVLTFGGPGPVLPGGPSYGGGFTVTVEIAQGQTAQGQAQEGTQVILRARPSEQAASYRWTFTSSASPVAVDRGYTDQLIIPRASAQDSGTYTCEVTSARGQSARGSANLYVSQGPSQPVTGRCSIDEATCRNGRCIPRAYLHDGKNDCGDNSDEGHAPGGDICQPNEIRCTDHNRGRKCVQKFWMCDGDRDCDDGSDEDQRYCELLPRQRHCKPSEFHCGGPNATTPNPVCIPRSFQCDGYNDCPDRSDEVGCVKPNVISAPQRQIQINVGQTLTIQCTARGSPAPYINWRLNWGHVCGDGSDNGRCQMAQSIDPNDPSLVTGTLTVRNVNTADGGAYSCEALNNQGFIFAIPDAIVQVIIDQSSRGPQAVQCNCNGHSSYCSPDGRCLNCQHNTAGSYCEYCAPGFQGDALRGTPYDCQPIVAVSSSRCDQSGTHMERGGRCICKYNVEGDRCDQCKRSHFYLNPTTPNGCLPCFCSGVSTDCSSTDWRRQAVALPLSNWNAVPKNFATDRYEARDQIKKLNGGREISLDQNSLGRPAGDVLYWKAPKEVLGDVVTLYDGNIDVHFTNDGQDNQAPSADEFIWLRGNNIDLIHKLPQTQRFKANTNATYSVPCNERTFTRKDGTYIDRENILMALSDLDTLLVKINPIGGRRSAVLRGVTLNVASRDGYVDAALTVESCRCPANYTGTSCEKCAEGYGRPHPLIGIYLGQCWSCRSVCHERSDQCDRETGKCSNCQGNSEGERCERCRAGFVLDARTNQCVPADQYQPYPSQPTYGTGSRGAYYVNQQPYDAQSQSPLQIVLDGNRPEQRIPLQVLNAQPQSVVWGRTDGSALPANVVQEGNDLVFRSPSAEQAGNYICTITHPDGAVERVNVYLDYRPGQQQQQPAGPPYGQPLFNPPSPYTIDQGASQLIQPQGSYYQVQWRRDGGQPLPAGVYQNGNGLQIRGARPDHAGIYNVELLGAGGTPITVPYEVRVRTGDGAPLSGGGPPKISIEPRVINLKEGQRMIVEYTVSSHDPIEVVWNKWTGQNYQPIPSLFRVEQNRLVLERATPDAAGTYQVVVRNPHGEDRQELTINVAPRRGSGRGGSGGGVQQAGAPQVVFRQNQYEVGYGEVVDIVPNISGASGSTLVWSKDGSTYLPDGVTARADGALRVEGRPNIDGQYTLDVTNAYGRSSSAINIRGRDASGQQSGGSYASPQRPKVQWNVQTSNLEEGRRLEAVCRTDVDPSTLRLEITRDNGRQREQAPLGLSFSNGYLSLGAVTRQDNGLQFKCSSGDASNTLTLNVISSSNPQDGSRSYIDVRLESRDEQSHQIGRDIHLQCSVHGSVERPYEYTFTKDGRSLENNVEVHPNGLFIIRNAQANDAGRYRCEVSFPRAPEAGTQEGNYDLRIEGGSAAGYDQGYQYGGEQQQPQQPGDFVEASVEPADATIGRGEKANLTCHVKGAQKYTVTWGKYAHDKTLPNYARQEGNSVIIAPTNDSPAEQMYLQCQVDVPGQAQPTLAYAPVTIRGDGESRKKKKKRRL